MPAYLDHAASTPTRPEVVEAMLPWWRGPAANATGSHRDACAARRAIETARETLAAAIGVEPDEVVFTSGGTESDNLSIFGAIDAAAGAGDAAPPALCSAIEHPAVLEPVERVGGRTVAVRGDGVIDLAALEAALHPDLAVVSVMAVNNEVGTIQPVPAVAAMVRERAPRAVVHTDAVQAVGWLDPRPLAAVVDTMSISGHKIGGPQGVGALVWKRGIPMAARQLGGGQERDRRAGTQNTAGIVGLAAAAAITTATRDETVARVAKLRDRLVQGIVGAIGGAAVIETGVVDGDRSGRVAGCAHLCCVGVESEALLFLLDRAGVAASAASSCASGAQGPSHVLEAMGVARTLSGGAVRLSLGWSTTEEEIEEAIVAVAESATRLRRTGS